MIASVSGGPRAAHAIAYARQPANRGRWVSELCELLAYPSVSATSAHRGDVAAAAAWLARHLARLGLDGARVLPGTGGGAPSVFAQWLHAPDQPTVLLYGHFDVQPAAPKDGWRTHPFRPAVVDQHVVGRGAADDKGQLFAHLKAIEGFLATDHRLPVNVKVWLEGEEEIGSPHLEPFLDRYPDLLRADAVLVSDTEMAAIARPSIVVRLRGMVVAELRLGGPGVDLHSGRFGGAVTNPIHVLCQMLASLHDRDGQVAVPGFHARVRPGSAGGPGLTRLERSTLRPAIDVNGIAGGSVVESKTIIPAEAVAKLSARLVPDQDPADIAELLRTHFTHAPPPGVRVRFSVSAASRPTIVPRDHPVMHAASRAVARVWGVPPLFTSSGGTIAVVEALQRRLAVPVVLLGFGLPGDNIHAPNEHLHLGQFFRGVETVMQFLAECER
jgi:acetylornithine deacetylase/succinyl-diaminopimelate desuccinylase-like protein